MKKCPQCGRDYDNTMMFCLDDGAELLYGPASAEEPATAIVESGESEDPQARTAVFSSQPSTGSSDAIGYGDEGFWVSVTPFRFDGKDDHLSALATGLTEDVVAGLARFSYLNVVSLGSSKAGVHSPATFLIEAGLRRVGSTVRLAVQIIDNVTGANLWAEKYSFEFDPENTFAIQDKLAPQIVSTVADMHGVLPRTMGERVRNRPMSELTPYEALVRSFGYFERVTPEEWRTSLDGVDVALKEAPEYATLRAMRALLLVQGYAQGFDVSEEPLEIGASSIE